MCLNTGSCRHHEAAGQCTCGGSGAATEGFHLREATLKDVALLLALISELATFEGLQHEVEANPILLAQHLFGDSAFAHAFIAEQNGTPAGFAVWYPTYSTFLGKPGAFLEDLYVRPHFRRRGLGRQLLAAAASQALAKGCARLEWRALKWNTSALAFYKKLGAEPLAEWVTLRMDHASLFAAPTQVWNENGPAPATP